jgi:hypothetical protein
MHYSPSLRYGRSGLKKVHRTFLLAFRKPSLTPRPEKFFEFFDPPPRGGWDFSLMLRG